MPLLQTPHPPLTLTRERTLTRGGDLAVAIALLAQTLATQNVHPQATPNTPAVLATSLTRL